MIKDVISRLEVGGRKEAGDHAFDASLFDEDKTDYAVVASMLASNLIIGWVNGHRGVFDYSDRLICVASINRYTVPIGVLYAKEIMSKKTFIRDLSCCDSPTA